MHSLLRSNSSVPRPAPKQFVRFLTKEELRSATNAFNRARGHLSCLQVGHFQDILLHEAFVAIPEHLIQKIFCEWDISSNGEISCSEFISGIATAIKGSRDDHLEMVFRMISANGDGKTATKADVACFFNCFATSSGCVAIEQSKTLRSWTVDELLHEIFGWSKAGRTTFKKFRAVLVSGNSFSALHFVDWIPTLAKRLLNMQRDDLPALSMPRTVTSFTLFEPYESFSTDQREDLRFELRSILFTLATEPTGRQISSIIDKIRDIVVDVQTISNALLSQITSGEIDQTMEPHVVDQVRVEVKTFVLGLFCIQASSAHQVYRLLFELFNEFSRGQLDVDQLSVFLQLAKGLRPIDSEREATIIMRKRGRSQSSLPTPPASPSGSPFINPEDQQVLTCSQFIEVAQQQPGFSFAEVESALLLLHLKRYSNSIMISGHDSVPLQHLLDCYFSEETFSQSNAFCVLHASEWQQIVARLLNCQPDLVTNSSVQIIHEEARELPFGHVMIPLPVWFLVSFWLEMENKKTLSQQPGFDWVSTVQLHRDDQSYLHGYWLRVSLTLTSCDGFERNAKFPQIIAFEQCTVQSIVDAVLFQKNWCGRGEDANSKVATMCQCQVLIAERNSIGEIKALIHQEDPTILPPDQLAAPLRSVLSSICPSWVLDSLLRCEKLSFEIQISVVEIEEQCEIEPPVLKHNDVSYDAPKYGYSFQQVSQPRNRVPRGLNNLGNTCFMNAVVQCLAATLPLRPHVFQEELQYNLPGSGNGLTQIGSKPLPLLLGELFTEMNRDKEKVTDASTSLSPTILLKAFQDLSPHMADGNQQDAQEFLVCLLGHVGNSLKRNLKQNTEPHILSPRSYDILTSIFRSKGLTSEDNVSAERKSLQLSIEDSNGRHDRIVATEWWVSHILNEPSVTNILFSGQFKSSLTCDHCHHQSARFEPFSSLQLPVIECNTSSTATRNDQQDLVVIIHASESSGSLAAGHGPVRTVVQIEEHSTVAAVLAQLTMPEADLTAPQYIIGDLNQFTIQNLLVTDSMEDQLDDKTPATALSNPVHAFETFNVPGFGDDTAAPVAESPHLYLRFVHRQNFLVPFYCSTPIRQTLCGSPFVCFSKRGGLTGQSLHQMVLHKFLLGHSTRLNPRLSSAEKIKRRSEKYAPNFVLRRVRDDGVACSRCHWTTDCLGCPILPTTTAAELLDLENCETIAIDWDLLHHPQDQSAFWWLQSYAVRDHPSYIHYRRTKTQSLMQSLQSLCSTDHLDANCSNCQQQTPSTLTPHTKQLSLWSLPPILVLQLKRFDLITVNGNYQWKKLTHSVDFPIQGLDLIDLLAEVEGAHSDSEPCSDRCSKDKLDPRVRRGITFLQNELHIPLTSASRSCTKYDLYAVVNHSGSGMSSGHYTAHTRRPDETCWWLADDAKVSPLHDHQLSPSTTAYLLFYVRQDIATGRTELEDLFPRRSTM